ncbi:protein of unknown function [Pseudorhizobium banfieldiae]|uniref:Uncharacterized protein n=1 Tax=Pseudorhizobium banfieldiae TaxID=1125847 RepID=L0NKC1_9HYPH|nr:protein of unknown function [Pseudorhizobium banfieldiae]
MSPKETSVPCDRAEASATTSSAGKPRSDKMLSISRPTLPVAPTTAILKPMIFALFLPLLDPLRGKPRRIAGFLVPGLTGERAAGQRRQTVFVVVLAVVLLEAEKHECSPAPCAGWRSAAM